jgi:hypothetical protein
MEQRCETLRRSSALAVDRALSKAENLWVRLAGYPERRLTGAHVDASTGRTSTAHLVERRLSPSVWPWVMELIERGADSAEIMTRLNKVFEDQGESLARILQRRAPQMLRENRALDRAFRRRMRATWGPAFDAVYSIWVCIEEIGSDAAQMNRDSNDLLAIALLGLHARNCLLLAEVHALVSSGFGLGAWARTRSLHENAVIMSVLSEHGRDEATADLAERFIRHGVIDAARDLELQLEEGVPVAAERLAEVRASRAALLMEYGEAYRQDYGWARPLFADLAPKARVDFRMLEKLADTTLARSDYRLGGHHIHASSRSVELNLLPYRGEVYRITGPTNTGLGGPAVIALDAALVGLSALVYGLHELPEPLDLVGLAAVRQLASQAETLLAEAQQEVDRREMRLQRHMPPTSTEQGE